jgi:hypothetical protein
MNSHPDTRRLRHLRGEIDFQRDQLLKKLHAADDHAALGDIFRALHSMLYPKPVTTKGRMRASLAVGQDNNDVR